MPVLISAIVGVTAYLNAYVAPPLLAGLTEQGMGAAMAAVWSLVKPRVFAAYFLLGLAGAIISRLVFQMVV